MDWFVYRFVCNTVKTGKTLAFLDMKMFNEQGKLVRYWYSTEEWLVITPSLTSSAEEPDVWSLVGHHRGCSRWHCLTCSGSSRTPHEVRGPGLDHLAQQQGILESFQRLAHQST